MAAKKFLILLFSISMLLVTTRSHVGQLVAGWTHKFTFINIGHQIQQAHQIATDRFPFSDDMSHTLSERFFPPNSSIDPNSHIKPLVACRYQVNQRTQHVRIPFADLHDIQMTPKGTPSVEGNYFNPAILRLPAESRYDYVIFSRLVTSGFHQETHFCPAVINATTRDIRCSLTPKRLNIAPTAAYRCLGRWASFADIPGFHDPRVLWSGKGEPLIIVNSASSARPNGCIGLWVVDLRNVIDELDQWLQENWHEKSEREDGKDVKSTHGISKARWLSKVSYPHLTEITKNPRSSRRAVEKNWVLFFPHGEESWVMYDMVKYSTDGTGPADSAIPSAVGSMRPTIANVSKNENSGEQWLSRKSAYPATEGGKLDLGLQGRLNKSNPDSTVTMSSTKNNSRHFHTREAPGLQQKRSTSPTLFSNTIRMEPSRSFAKLLGSGFTTTNLTSPNESPCFGKSHTRDNLNNGGYWHQGSNSLRLVLCHRPRPGKKRSSEWEQCFLDSSNEMELVQGGQVVHFMVMHRKFSNSFLLPMRYERYLLVWEARWPFRVLGVTSHPILFAGERAEPWSKEENWPHEKLEEMEGIHMRRETEKWQDTYFSYTPSLAWAKRSPETEEVHSEAAHDLGTGYIGDKVIVGIGMDDNRQGFLELQIEDLLSCLRLCPDFE